MAVASTGLVFGWRYTAHPKRGAPPTNAPEVSAFTLSRRKKAKSNLK